MTTRDELRSRFRARMDEFHTADEWAEIYADETLDWLREQLGRPDIVEAARRKMAFRPGLGESETTRLMLAEVVRVLSEPTETP